MARYKIVIGNQNYSSWSLAGWLTLEQFGLDYDVEKIYLFKPESKPALLKASACGKVPVLFDQALPDQPIWDSLAIAEHLAHAHPEYEMWPNNPNARAFARSVAAEVHSSYASLRQTMPMNIKRRGVQVEIDHACKADLLRVYALIAEGQRQFSSIGPFVAGNFSLADVMLAPVVWRLTSYVHDAPKPVAEYCKIMRDLPAMTRWEADGLAEHEVIESYDALGSTTTST